MISPEQYSFDQLFEALPSSFNFYHLGKVELLSESDFPASPHLPPSPLSDETSHGLSFHLRGDLNATFIVLFRKDLDLSIYSELGNILASKIANQLLVEKNLQIAISPPHALSNQEMERLFEIESFPVRRTYVHQYENRFIYLETLFMSSLAEEIGNA